MTSRYPAEPDVLQVVRSRGGQICTDADIASDLRCSFSSAHHVLKRMVAKGKLRCSHLPMDFGGELSCYEVIA